MSKKLATLTLGLLLFVPAWAEEEAAVRVQNISKVSDSAPSKLVQKRPSDKDGYPVTLNSTGYVKDHYITDKNTVAALEFLIGGRVGINRDTDIEIVNERSIADGKTPTKRIKLKSGSLWVKADAKSLKQPVEIQTNGGVMGIKGTEFTVETQADGTDRVCCFESNSSQGGVEIRDNSGKVVGTVKPGEEYLVALKKAPVVTPHSDIQQFRQDTIQRNFGSFENSEAGRMFLGFASYIPGSGNVLYFAHGGVYGANVIANLITNPAQAGQMLATEAKNRAASEASSRIGGPLGSAVGFGIGSIDTSGGSSEPPKPDFPYDLSPDASPESTVQRETGAYPSLSWKPIDDVESYAVMIGRDADMNDVVFMDQTKNTQLNYPSSNRPLAAGKYFWRIVPLDNEDHPVKKACQTYFNVK